MLITDSWYRKEESDYFIERVKNNQTSLMVCLPGFGRSSFLKILKDRIETETINTVLVDLNMLNDYSTSGFFTFLFDELKKDYQYKDNRKKKSIEGYLDISHYFLDTRNNSEQVVFLLDRFEKVCELFPKDLFDSIRAVATGSTRKVTFIIGIDREITDIRNSDDIEELYTLINLFTYYLKPVNKKEATKFLQENSKEIGTVMSEKEMTEAYTLTGGHLRLLKTLLILKQSEETITKDKSIIFQCERLYNHLNTQFKEALMRHINNLKPTPADVYPLEILRKMGIIDKNNKVFSKFFEDYLYSINDLSKRSLLIDTTTGEIYKNGIRLDTQLSANEYKLVRFLEENSYQVIDRDRIADCVWGASTNEGVTDESIDQLVSRLREKIEDDKNNPQHITTIRGRGFQFKP
jgi:hypothetical protein